MKAYEMCLTACLLIAKMDTHGFSKEALAV